MPHNVIIALRYVTRHDFELIAHPEAPKAGSIVVGRVNIKVKLLLFLPIFYIYFIVFLEGFLQLRRGRYQGYHGNRQVLVR